MTMSHRPIYIHLETEEPDREVAKHENVRHYWDRCIASVPSITVAIGQDEELAIRLINGKGATPQDENSMKMVAKAADDPEVLMVFSNANIWQHPTEIILGTRCANVWCLKQGSQGAWPCLPSGKDLTAICNFIDVKADTTIGLMRGLLSKQLEVLPECEQSILMLTQRLRSVNLNVSTKTADKSLADLIKIQTRELCEVAKIFGDRAMKNMMTGTTMIEGKAIQEFERRFGISIPGTSLEHINPVLLLSNPLAAKILLAFKRINAISGYAKYLTRWKEFGRFGIDLEYGGAHTRRLTSKSRYLAIPFHGLPKSDEEIAKAVRTTVRLDDDHCFVRTDLGQAEFRMCGYLTDCPNVAAIFDPSKGGQYLADPYVTGWKQATGQTISKKDVRRKIEKKVMISETYRTGDESIITQLALASADTKNKLPADNFREIAKEQQWDITLKDNPRVLRLIERLKLDPAYIHVGWSLHRRFNEIHSDFQITAQWLVDCVDAVATSTTLAIANERLRNLRSASAAPKPDKICLKAERRPGTSLRPSVIVTAGHWPESLTWREPAYRFIRNERGERMALSILKEDGEVREFTTTISLQNVVQTAARNAMAKGLLELAKRGFRDVASVHDEALVIVPRKRGDVLAARQALLDCFGPGNNLGYGWAVATDPSEMTVTSSLWETLDDVAPEKGRRWERIEANEPGCLDDLP